MSAAYKCFSVSYGWSGGYGAFQDYCWIVIAETKEKAIGMACQANPETSAAPDCWSAQEIPLSEQGVYYVSERGS
jgi:hypothetical protein